MADDALATADLWSEIARPAGRRRRSSAGGNEPRHADQHSQDHQYRPCRAHSREACADRRLRQGRKRRAEACRRRDTRIEATALCDRQRDLHARFRELAPTKRLPQLGDPAAREEGPRPACGARRSVGDRGRAHLLLRPRGAVQRRRGDHHFRLVHGRLQLSPAPALGGECRHPLPCPARRTDRPAEPQAVRGVHGRDLGEGHAERPQGGALHPRPRRLQGGQRHARPPGRRRAAQGLRQAAEWVAQGRRPSGAALRRRIRHRRCRRSPIRPCWRRLPSAC